MPKTFSIETVVRAEKLYCLEGHTLQDVARRTGVSMRALHYWSQKHGWKEKRLEICRTLLDISTKTLLLREKLIDNCITTLNAQDIFAVASLEAIAKKQERDDPAKPPVLPRKARPGKGAGENEAVAELEKACHNWMHNMAADPGQLNLEAIRTLKAAMDLVRDFKKEADSPEDQRGGLSDEAADEIRRKILGIPPNYDPNNPKGSGNSPTPPGGKRPWW